MTASSMTSPTTKATTAVTATTAVVPLPTRMLFAALSGMGAASCCHPFDVIRVRLQTGSTGNAGVIQTAVSVYQGGGLYAGIGAAYLRQWTYGSCRMGIYSYLLETSRNNNKDVANYEVPFLQKLGMGSVSGAIGSFVGTPSELALVRLSNDGKLPPAKRRNYQGVFDCLKQIATTEPGGIRAWWTGGTPTVLRATLLSSCQMGVTSQTKLYFKSTGYFEKSNHNKQDTHPIYQGDYLGGIPLLFCSTLVSSFCANIVANPFDVIKSRIQNQQVSADTGVLKYNGSIDCLKKSVQQEGIMVLYKGFGPAFVKLAPYTVISLTLVDTMTKYMTGKDAL
mmetsp:Transcript_18595/g.18834  ORF Transcript_18595/g.18834 Transcript_18595/m.18834 type:complete len:337 (+) Transcript_18595:74-1084(+)